MKENDIYFIAEALKINKTLKKLYICCKFLLILKCFYFNNSFFVCSKVNWFSLKAVDYIANALKINNTLNFIDLSGT